MSIPTVGQAKSMYHHGDTRHNLYELSPQLDWNIQKRIKLQAQSIACLVRSTDFTEDNRTPLLNRTVKLSRTSLAQKLQDAFEKKYYWMKETKFTYIGNFGDEPSPGCGTAFLVGKKQMLTTGHCICDATGHIFTSKLKVIFGFKKRHSGHIQTKFDSKNVYSIKHVLNFKKEVNADWALLELDREVEGREPLSLSVAQKIALGIGIYMIGHPSGLPLKVTLGGQVKKTDVHVFEADIDAFAGNSGSPIFEYDTGNLIGMLIKGHTDYTDSTSAENKQEKIIKESEISEQVIAENGYERCQDIDSIEFLKTTISSYKRIPNHAEELPNLEPCDTTQTLSKRDFSSLLEVRKSSSFNTQYLSIGYDVTTILTCFYFCANNTKGPCGETAKAAKTILSGYALNFIRKATEEKCPYVANIVYKIEKFLPKYAQIK